MRDRLPSVYFYIPESDWPADYIPQSPETYWQWMKSRYEMSESNQMYKYLGKYNWTLQAYLYLKADGFPCELTNTLPEEGIVLSHRNFLPFHLQPKPRLLLVCIKADYEQHPYAQLHIVQNPQETKTIRDSYYIPNWPQPGLLPRNPGRGDRFENIAFFGIEKNLAPELRDLSWQEQLKALGLRWQVVSRAHWNDYRDVDAILAVRNFCEQESYSWKPATKLYNAWHADVPAILARESAFQAERKSELDYLEVTSLNDAILALKRLRDDLQLRHAMVENGRVRAEETKPAKLVSQWHNFITDVAVPAYDRWCKASSWNKHSYVAHCYLKIQENYLQPLYEHDRKHESKQQIGFQERVIISMMQVSRTVNRKVERLLRK
ncbi:MAG: hypothetical protein LDL41_09130 [Coleofasciculus sp. S288]|nr:hypothetical protein [Coleofasciculus sp. S288]